MSREAVKTEIIDQMQRLYLPPRSMTEDNIRTALDQYADALAHYDGPDLQSAWKEVRDSHDKSAWPSVAKFVKAARQARDLRLGTTRERSFANPDRPSVSALWSRWVNARSSPEAMEAVEAECAWSFKCSILHDGKTVQQVSIAKLQSDHRRAEALADRIRRGVEDPPMTEEIARVALQLWDDICVKEIDTVKEIRDAQRSKAA